MRYAPLLALLAFAGCDEGPADTSLSTDAASDSDEGGDTPGAPDPRDTDAEARSDWGTLRVFVGGGGDETTFSAFAATLDGAQLSEALDEGYPDSALGWYVPALRVAPGEREVRFTMSLTVSARPPGAPSHVPPEDFDWDVDPSITVSVTPGSETSIFLEFVDLGVMGAFSEVWSFDDPGADAVRGPLRLTAPPTFAGDQIARVVTTGCPLSTREFAWDDADYRDLDLPEDLTTTTGRRALPADPVLRRHALLSPGHGLHRTRRLRCCRARDAGS